MAKTEEYKIKMKDGTEQKVTGIVINKRWGIDKRQQEVKKETRDGEKVTLSSSYCITHIPTGILVTSANTQRALKELANREDMWDEDDFHKMAVAVGKFWNEKGWQG